MTAHIQMRESKVVLNQQWVPVRLTDMYPDLTDVCRSPEVAVYTVVVWLMCSATCAWVGDGSSHTFVIPSPVHGEEMGFLLTS